MSRQYLICLLGVLSLLPHPAQAAPLLQAVRPDNAEGSAAPNGTHPPPLLDDLLDTTPPMEELSFLREGDLALGGRNALSGLSDRADQSSSGPSDSSRDFVVTSEHGRLAGLFVQPCTVTGEDELGLLVSRMEVRAWLPENRFELDRTYYRGDRHCRPGLASLDASMRLSGEVRWRGESPLLAGASRAQLRFTNGTLFFSDTQANKAVVALLNTHCPCNSAENQGEIEAKQGWAVNQWRSVEAEQCSVIENGDSAPSLCKLLSGEYDYFSYGWVDGLRYATSRDMFADDSMEEDDIFVSNAIVSSNQRHRITSSGNTDPQDCAADEWRVCENALELAAEGCRSCQGIQCDACLFHALAPRFLTQEPPVLSPSSEFLSDMATARTNWHRCCPCMHAFATKRYLPWMKVTC